MKTYMLKAKRDLHFTSYISSLFIVLIIVMFMFSSCKKKVLANNPKIVTDSATTTRKVASCCQASIPSRFGLPKPGVGIPVKGK